MAKEYATSENFTDILNWINLNRPREIFGMYTKKHCIYQFIKKQDIHLMPLDIQKYYSNTICYCTKCCADFSSSIGYE